MSFPKFVMFFAVALFGGIGMIALFKGQKPADHHTTTVVEVNLQDEVAADQEKFFAKDEPRSLDGLPDQDAVWQLFNTGVPKLPIVKTITYQSRVDWLKGRPAWLVDYSSHFDTSRHFIARSLNGRADYDRQDVRNGDQFNIFDPDIDLNFHLVVDLSRCRLWFYYKDNTNNETVLLKSYPVGLGRRDKASVSGLLTPLGVYQLGDRVDVIRPKKMGNYRGERVELIGVFGTRWIPFDKEVVHCTKPARGFGIHGNPFVAQSGSDALVEDDTGIGRYESDGCIRMRTEDVEEMFSIIVSKPTTVELVEDFADAKL